MFSLLHLFLNFDVHLLDGFQVDLDEAALGLQGTVLLEALFDRAVRVLLSELGSQIAVFGLNLDDKLEDFLSVGLCEIGKGVLFEFSKCAGLAELTLKQLFKSTVHMVINIIAKENFWGYFLISQQTNRSIREDSSDYFVFCHFFISRNWSNSIKLVFLYQFTFFQLFRFV